MQCNMDMFACNCIRVFKKVIVMQGKAQSELALNLHPLLLGTVVDHFLLGQ